MATALTDLPCPECTHRVGNHRKGCGTCNRFTQRVSRQLAASLRVMYPHDVERLRPQIEASVYADMGLGAA